MKERGRFPQPKEIGSVEAALKLAGDNAKKTSTLIFNTIKEYPLICVGMAMTISGLGGLAVGVAFHQLDTDQAYIMRDAGLLGAGLYMAGLVKEILDFPNYGDS